MNYEHTKVCYTGHHIFIPSEKLSLSLEEYQYWLLRDYSRAGLGLVARVGAMGKHI